MYKKNKHGKSWDILELRLFSKQMVFIFKIDWFSRDENATEIYEEIREDIVRRRNSISRIPQGRCRQL